MPRRAAAPCAGVKPAARWGAWSAIFAAAIALSPAAHAQDAPPQIALAAPLGVAPGAATRVVLRGWRLDKAAEVRCGDSRFAVNLLSQGAASVPGRQDAKQVGDTQVELEITAPADAAAGELALTVVSPAGESPPCAVLVGGEFPLLAETEPNEGFEQAQAVALPQIVEGAFRGDRDVDVFAFDGAAGEKIVVEALAARRGSAADPLLLLHDASGNLVAAADDDADGGPDGGLRATLPAAGRYRLTLLDAHDRGGPAHPYRLLLSRE